MAFHRIRPAASAAATWLPKFCSIAVVFLVISLTEGQKPVPPASVNVAKTGGAKKEIAIEGARFCVLDRDQKTDDDSAYTSLVFPQKVATAFPISGQSRARMEFTVRDKKATAPIIVHQAFVVLVHGESGREIIFVAQPDEKTRVYTIELDMKIMAKDFNGIGGRYTLSLILGDALVENPAFWSFADVQLSLPASAAPPQNADEVPKSRRVVYEMLPEISYTFKPAEKRPPTIVSDTFTLLCLAPLLILFVLWLKIGLNFGGAPPASAWLWALGFHGGLAAIFGLYTCYWLKLNMFQTLKWLALLGVPTFFFGNRLLRALAAAADDGRKKQKAE